MRACIVETTRDNELILRRHLPPNVTVAAVNQPFEKVTIELRLEGDGLPAWCEKTSLGYYMRAVIDVLADGSTRLVPGSGIPVQQVHPDIKE